MKLVDRIETCYCCNLFHLSCDGSKLYAKKKKSTKKGSCQNREQSSDNTISPLQLEAFHSLYRTKVKGGMPSVNAFAEAIIQTSDLVFEIAKKEKKHLIVKYENRL